MIDFTQFSDKKKEKRGLKPIVHIPLGLWSFDNAFMGFQSIPGLPLDALVEVAGATSTGKSSLIYSLSGLISKEIENKIIAMVDMEGFDPSLMSIFLNNAGFSGNVSYCNALKDEMSLDNMIDSMFEGAGVGILDSIGAISPLSEQEGDLGEANMGRRAKLMAQFSRKAIHMMNNTSTPKVIWMNNHLNANLAGRGFITPGGETKKFLSTIIMRVKRKEEFPDGSYIIEGSVTKNRYGFRGKIFHLFMLSGYGIHKGLTAMYECFLADLATRTKGIVRIGDTSYGRLKSIVLEKSNDPEFFMPFHELLKGKQNGKIGDFESDREENESGEDSDISDQTTD